MNLSGTIINNCYIIRELLSENSIGSLWSAQPIFSAKQFLLFFLNSDLIKQNKENIMEFKKKIFSSSFKIHEAFADIVEIDEFENNIYLSFEIGEGKSLKEYIRTSKSISMNNIYSVIENIAETLEAMHEKKIFHGMLLSDYVLVAIKQDRIDDVKILNFYFDELRKIIDFKIDKNEKLFYPAEIVENRFDDIDKSSDLYFLGIILYQLLTLSPDFKKVDIDNVSNLNIEDTETRSILIRVLKRLLNNNKENRYPDTNTFFEDFYLISKKGKKVMKDKKEVEKNDVNGRSYNNRQYFEQLDYQRKSVDVESSKSRIEYFNRLETDRKKYYDKSDYEERKLYFEKLDRERREYYNRVANERKLYLDNLVSNTRKYLTEINDRKVAGSSNIDSRQKAYFEDITRRTRTYAEDITGKIKEYYDYLSSESKKNISKDKDTSALINSYFSNIVTETARDYKNLVEEARKYYLNLSNEAKNYSENIKSEDSGERGRKYSSNSETNQRNKFYDSLKTETIEYFKKLENEANDYSKKIIKDWELRGKKNIDEKGAFDEIGEERKDFYTDKKEKDATVKYFENIEKEKKESKNEKIEGKEEKSEFQEYLEERNRYYKGENNGYKEEHTDYFNKSNDRVKQSFDKDKDDDKTENKYNKIKIEEVGKKEKSFFWNRDKDSSKQKESEYSLRDDFVKKNHWLSFFKKLFYNASRSSGNICIIDIGDDDNFDQFINKFKDMNLKKGSGCIDINCKNYKSDNVFKNILKKYEELKKNDPIKYDFNISSKSVDNIEKVSEFILNMGEKKKPFVVILREIHFIDNISLFILHKIISRIPNFPLLFICTYRKDELNDNELLKKIAS